MKHPQLQPSSDETPTLELLGDIANWLRHVEWNDHSSETSAYDYAQELDLLAAALAVHEQERRKLTVEWLNEKNAQLDAERRRWYASLETAFGLPKNALEGFAPEVAAEVIAQPKEKTDFSAALLPADPSASVKTETLPTSEQPPHDCDRIRLLQWGAKCDEPAKPEVGPMQDAESLSGVQALGSSGPSQVEQMVTVLKAACDRDWKDETPLQVARIVANAIYWRDQTIARLKTELEEARELYDANHG